MADLDPSSGGTQPARTWEGLWILLPLAMLFVYSLPNLDYLLPGYQSGLGENYQPLRAMKFYSSLGGEVHKYGPMPNFVLLPLYGSSLAYWWATGSFGQPSGDFPYGFEEPLAQLSWLIFSGRLLFLLVGLGLYWVMLQGLRRTGLNAAFVGLAFLFCIGTNYAAIHFLANTRPDGMTYAFVAASMGVYARILHDGPSRARGIALSVLAVCAISSKELAGPVYVLPYLGLGGWLWQRSRQDPTLTREHASVALLSVLAGVGAYLLINVVYAPVSWWERISHWLGGAGTSKDVWMEGGAETASVATRALNIVEGLLNTLGPGGWLVVLTGVVTLLVIRPRTWLLLLLPFISITMLGLWPLGFPGDRFYTVATVTLVLPVAVGLGLLWERIRTTPIRALAVAVCAVAFCANAVFATWAWHKIESLPERVVERVLKSEAPRFAGTINILKIHPDIPGKSQLTDWGFQHDVRSMTQLVEAEVSSLPDRIMVDAGALRFVEYAAESEARAELLRGQGFEIKDWPGLEGLGYQRIRTVATPTPGWFPFDWMPAVQWQHMRSPMFVYERVARS